LFFPGHQCDVTSSQKPWLEPLALASSNLSQAKAIAGPPSMAWLLGLSRAMHTTSIEPFLDFEDQEWNLKVIPYVYPVVVCIVETV